MLIGFISGSFSLVFRMVQFRLIVLSLLLLSFAPGPNPDAAKKIIENMLASTENVRTLKFTLKKQERINGEMKTGEQEVKFNRSPQKVYTLIHSPNKGVEILYVEGKNDNDAYVNPNAFPYINVNLDPYGSHVRKNNHHTVNEVGFDYVKGIVSRIYQSSGDNADKIFLYEGDVKFDGRDCYKIVIDYFPYKYIPYTVKAGETLTSIGYKNFVSDYMLMEINKLDWYDDVKPGQRIMMPNAYARKTILYIDKENGLPIVQMMYDEKGLYEQYEFHNLQLNPVITEEEFTRNYKDYDF